MPADLRKEKEKGQGALRLVDEGLDAVAAGPARLAAAAADAGVADGLVDGVAVDPATLEATAVADDLVDGVAAVRAV